MTPLRLDTNLKKIMHTTNFFEKTTILWTFYLKKKAKFDIQNPIIGSLLEEINKGKVTEKGRIEAVKGTPNPKGYRS